MIQLSASKNFSAITLLVVSVFSVVLIFSSCKKEEEDPDDNGTPNPVHVLPANGCYVQEILAWNFNPLFTYEYDATHPNVLTSYKKYNEISNTVTHSYVMKYNSFSPAYELDSIIHYFGDFETATQFYEVTTFHYTFTGDSPRLDSAVVYSYDPVEADLTNIKGIIYYEYNADGLLASEEYYDIPESVFSTIYDEYTIEYSYDAEDRLIAQDWYNYSGEYYYYEHYTPSEYLQPNYFVVPNPVLAQSLLYAPQQTIAWYSGTGTYTYNYLYQVNTDNYVIQQDHILMSGDTTADRLLTYECY